MPGSPDHGPLGRHRYTVHDVEDAVATPASWIPRTSSLLTARRLWLDPGLVRALRGALPDLEEALERIVSMPGVAALGLSRLLRLPRAPEGRDR